MALKSILAISSADSQDKSSAELSSRRGGAALIRYIARPQGYFARVQVNLPKILVGGAQESHWRKKCSEEFCVTYSSLALELFPSPCSLAQEGGAARG